MFWTRKILCALCLIGVWPAPNLLAEDNNSSWLSADFSVGNSVGIGTFVSGFTRSPQWTTSLTIAPQARISLPSSWPKIYADAELSANLWWLNSIQTSAFDANNRVQFPDLLFGLSAPVIYEFSDIGLSFSASIPLIIPISKSSVVINRLVGSGLRLGAKWKLGQFSLAYSPSAVLWAHRGEAKVVPCFDSEGKSTVFPGLVNPQNPDFDVGQYMLSLAAFRDEDPGAFDKCTIVGRQSLGSLKNGVTASWGNDSHKVAVGLTYYWNFLRPLESRPELASVYSKPQSFTQAALGKVVYTYVLPLPIDTSISAGVTSYGSIFSKRGTIVFPFFDFMTPQNNQTQFFVDMTASL